VFKESRAVVTWSVARVVCYHNVYHFCILLAQLSSFHVSSIQRKDNIFQSMRHLLVDVSIFKCISMVFTDVRDEVVSNRQSPDTKHLYAVQPWFGWHMIQLQYLSLMAKAAIFDLGLVL